MEVKELIIQAEPNFLDQLLMMGYSHEVSKKALIETKNVGLVEAIDAIPNIVLQMKDSQKLKDQKQLNVWGCPDCTFINNPQNYFCEVCDKEAPEEAYIVVKKEIPKEEPKEQSKPRISEEDIK
jgi:hypothetical protein